MTFFAESDPFFARWLAFTRPGGLSPLWSLLGKRDYCLDFFTAKDGGGTLFPKDSTWPWWNFNFGHAVMVLGDAGVLLAGLYSSAPNRDSDYFKSWYRNAVDLQEPRTWVARFLEWEKPSWWDYANTPIASWEGVKHEQKSRVQRSVCLDDGTGLEQVRACAQAFLGLEASVAKLTQPSAAKPSIVLQKTVLSRYAHFLYQCYLLDALYRGKDAARAKSRSWLTAWWDDSRAVDQFKKAVSNIGTSTAESVKDAPRVVGNALGSAANVIGEAGGNLVGGFAAKLGFWGVVFLGAIAIGAYAKSRIF